MPAEGRPRPRSRSRDRRPPPRSERGGPAAGSGASATGQLQVARPAPPDDPADAADSSGSGSESPRDRPNFEATGVLATDAGETYKGRTLKWTVPEDMKQSRRKWMLFVLRDGVPIEGREGSFELSRRPAYMFGRDVGICDIPLMHPSISLQHAVLVFRSTALPQSSGEMLRAVRPYLIDLGSTNGTVVNRERLQPGDYRLLRHKDLIQFGNSSREFVLLDAGA
eukprot:TRINITY_DN29447_c0_g1_i1.p1 TRINITY_DN29447_c0_g1~~TRINITY_DN29447_c0_g1_i1.p1  ORF type:complete len:250 (+),score=63.28 TRINITY_DN29447_c0_g1_i1:79-750(+)